MPTNNLFLSQKVWQKIVEFPVNILYMLVTRGAAVRLLLAPVQVLGELQHVSRATVQIQYFTINIHAKNEKKRRNPMKRILTVSMKVETNGVFPADMKKLKRNFSSSVELIFFLF